MSTSPELELVNYGAGHAWLRPELDTAIRDADQVHQDLTRTRCPACEGFGPHHPPSLPQEA